MQLAVIFSQEAVPDAQGDPFAGVAVLLVLLSLLLTVRLAARAVRTAASKWRRPRRSTLF